MKKLFLVLILFILCLGVGYSFYPRVQPVPKKGMILPWESSNKKDFNNHYFWRWFQEEFAKYGYEIYPQAVLKPEDADFVFITWPFYKDTHLKEPDKNFLWLMESPFYIDQIKNKKTEQKFNKIFTYDKNLLISSQYILAMHFYTFDDIRWELFNRPKTVLVMQVASFIQRKNSIYHMRGEATDWFMQHVPDDYVLYGRRWSKYSSALTDERLAQFKRVYRGGVKDKIDALSHAEFTLAFENAIGNGYISEKIFDAMKAGSIPIYFGAPDIDQYVPKDCYIDFRDFGSYEDLYAYLKNMSPEQKEAYRQAIRDFIVTFNNNPMDTRYVIQKMVKVMVDELESQK